MGLQVSAGDLNQVPSIHFHLPLNVGKTVSQFSLVNLLTGNER